MSQIPIQENEHIRKRRRLDTIQHEESPQREQPMAARIKLSHSDYTVGWICALSLELTAARSMLDVEHIRLPIPASDHNSYTLGSINGHNVVMVCLPSGTYGTTPAAGVAAHMMSTFKSITIPLMVGVGGGVPKPGYDIRLGDVVVSTPTSEYPAVVQYDYGKTTGVNGISEPKGTLNKPTSLLLRAVANLRATHQLKPSKVPGYIDIALRQNSLENHGYAYPGRESDILLEVYCAHGPGCPHSSKCKEISPIDRASRADTNPVIHYGTIASGNQVIKHGPTRDRLAQRSNVLCYETEAAGLMDDHQCLVIRGICDYCDVHKNKDFQGYAALAAAAFAKELLLTIPVHERASQSGLAQANTKTLEHRRTIMDALDFEDSDSRRATIKTAHSQTCKWLLEQSEYLDWLDPHKFDENHGLLWIKGKAGTGKSTIVKFVLEQALNRRDSDLVIISFFFNARGHDLEKSTVGMFRSLVHQLLKQIPEAQTLLDNLRSSAISSQATPELFERLFRDALKHLGTKHLMCFVDALDECPEEQVRRMVRSLEDVGNDAISDHLQLHVLFSSRHYPNISVDVSKNLILEEQDGHEKDIVKYINGELKIGKSKQADEIKDEILRKSAGIFLWVVLVIQILKTEYDKGRVHALRKRLQDIPMELNALFRDILTRDNHRLPELVLCLQWILYAKRPLSREEIYFALLADIDPETIHRWYPDVATVAVMNSFILDTSKGLAELSRSKKSSVQFIHESVRQFLMTPDALADLYPGFPGFSEGQSHKRLRQCCEKQLHPSILNELDLPSDLPPAKSEEAVAIREKAQNMFPFLDYSVHHVFYHTDQAECSGISQHQYLSTFDHNTWRALHNVMQKHQTRRLNEKDKEMDMICFLAKQCLEPLLAVQLSVSKVALNDLSRLLLKLAKPGYQKACITLCRTYHGHSGSVESRYPDCLGLLEIVFSNYNRWYMRGELRRDALLNVLLEWHCPPSQLDLNLALLTAVLLRNERAVTLICGKGADVNYIGCPLPPLLIVVHDADTTILQILLNYGADVNLRNHENKSPLHYASPAAAEILLANGADIGARDDSGRTALHGADSTTAMILLDNGAEVDARDRFGMTPLHCVCKRRDGMWLVNTVEKATILLHSGASIDETDNEGRTPLQAALLSADQELVELLYNHGADLSPPSKVTVTELEWSVTNMIVENVRSVGRKTLPCCDWNVVPNIYETASS